MTERKPRRLSGAVVDAPPELLYSIMPDVPGIGEGACEITVRAARKGLLLDFSRFLEGALGYDEDTLAPPKRRGRPHKDPMWSTDAKRAYLLWLLAREIFRQCGKPEGGHIQTQELVRVCQDVEKKLGISNRDSLFSGTAETCAPSVSRGKVILKIDKQWQSPTCEEIHSNFPQMTAPE